MLCCWLARSRWPPVRRRSAPRSRRLRVRRPRPRLDLMPPHRSLCRNRQRKHFATIAAAMSFGSSRHDGACSFRPRSFSPVSQRGCGPGRRGRPTLVLHHGRLCAPLPGAGPPDRLTAQLVSGLRPPARLRPVESDVRAVVRRRAEGTGRHPGHWDRRPLDPLPAAAPLAAALVAVEQPDGRAIPGADAAGPAGADRAAVR